MGSSDDKNQELERLKRAFDVVSLSFLKCDVELATWFSLPRKKVLSMHVTWFMKTL